MPGETPTVDVVDRTRSGVAVDGVEALVRHVLAAEGVTDAEVGVTLVGERRIRTLNREHRGVDAVTDVLSFPLEEPDDDVPEGVPRLLGDVVVCPLRARRQALAEGVAPANELAVLLTHGVLHLLGWEHDDVGAAVAGGPRDTASVPGRLGGEMVARQDELVREWDWERLW